MALASRTLFQQRLSQHIFRHDGQTLSRVILLSRGSTPFRIASPNGLQRRLQHAIAGQQYPPNPSQPNRTRTFLWGLLRTVVFAQACIVAGFAIGWSTLPMRPQILALLADPPTPEETLALYTPPDAASAAINTRIVSHPVAASLRSNADFVESRPHMRIPEALRRTNLIGGTLAGPGRIVVPQLQFSERSGKSFVSIFYLGPELCGHPGIVHGGLLATLLDEGLARCCFPALQSGIAVTANLKIDYRRPVAAEGYYVLRARTEKVDGRKAWVKGWIERLGDADEELGEAGGVRGVEEGRAKGEVDGKEKLVEAEALFIEPRNAKLLARFWTP